jgi:hypothetical protein
MQTPKAARIRSRLAPARWLAWAAAAAALTAGLFALGNSALRAWNASRAALVTVDVRSGLYETQRGRPVFYVRGDVENRTTQSARATVRVEIRDGQQLVRAAEVEPGGLPSPEELYAISTAADVEALSARLAQKAAPLSAGQKAPFLLAFYEYPLNIGDYRVEVSVTSTAP